jgi:hypothetical protein
MANHGLIIESQISADNTDALNRFAYSATTDFDGGALVELASPNVVGDDRYIASVPTATNGLWVAYNPADRHIDVEGRVFAGLIADDRVYTNLKGNTFTVFKPKAGVDLIDFTEDCVDASVADDWYSVPSLVSIFFILFFCIEVMLAQIIADIDATSAMTFVSWHN